MSAQVQIPLEIAQKWQGIVDLLAEIMRIPAALVMRVEPPNIKVFVSSESKGNPYEPDESACLNTGLYCETVMKTRQPLLVPDALEDEEWKSNPDIKLGMISYLGFPVTWPDGEIFGTICVLDNKKNEYSELYRRLLLQCRDVLQADLKSIATAEKARAQAEEDLQESVQQWRAVYEHNPTMYFMVDAAGIIRSVNPFGAEQLGYSVHELVGQPVLNVFYQPDREAIQRNANSCFEEPGRTMRWEARKIRKDGSMLWVRETANAVHLKNQLVLLVACEDVTERRQAEDLLAGEKRILEMVARGDSQAQILDGLCRLAEEQARDAMASILVVDGDRLRPGGAASLPKAFAIPPDGIVIGPSAGSCGTAAYRGESVIVSDIATDPLWDDARDLALSHSLRACWSTPIFSSEGKVIATFALYYREPRTPSAREQQIIEQISHLAGIAIQRKLTEEALKKSEERYRNLIKVSADGIYVINEDGIVVLSNPAGAELAGCSEEQLIGTPFTDTYPPQDRHLLRQGMEKSKQGPLRYEREFLRRNGDLVPVEVSFSALPATGHQAVIRDISARKSAEQALRQSEAYLAEAQKLSRTGSWTWSPTEDFTHWSEECYRVIGFDPLGGLPRTGSFFERLHPGDKPGFMEQLRRAFREKADFEVDFQIVHPDGAVRDIHFLGHPVLNQSGDLVEYLGTVIDITERKRAEEALRQAQADLAHINRVTTMGELATSLAHELNQPIAAAITNANTCLRWLAQADMEEAREAATRIVKDGTRAAEIISRIRSFYKKSAPQREWVDVNQVASEMLVLLRSEANRYSISMRTDLATELPKVRADRVQLQQVFMNLMLNGIDAMREANRRRELTIKSGLGETGQLLISVSDTGVGLPSGQADQIFNAFFTTKPQGTGMGLPISRSIIESHGGRLWASANGGPGTTFSFSLPTQGEAHE